MRVIPVVCFSGNRAINTEKFVPKDYLGDVLNVVSLFSDLYCDELSLVNLDDSTNLDLLQKISNRVSMPLSYAGAIKSIDDIETLLNCGIEKVILNSKVVLIENDYLEIINRFGASSISISVDYRLMSDGIRYCFHHSGLNPLHHSLQVFIELIENCGIYPGEIIFSNIESDGMWTGLDEEVLGLVSGIRCPIVLNCGLNSLIGIKNYSLKGVNGIMGASFFSFARKGQGVLINYGLNEELHLLKKKINSHFNL